LSNEVSTGSGSDRVTLSTDFALFATETQSLHDVHLKLGQYQFSGDREARSYTREPNAKEQQTLRAKQNQAGSVEIWKENNFTDYYNSKVK
jgi:hypothetical protein